MPRILYIHMWPIWLLGLLSGGKSFKANPILGARLLNFLGLHVLRVVLAHGFAHIRWLMLRPMMPPSERAAYHRDGFVALEGFLSADEVKAIRAELAAYKGEARQMLQGDTATQKILLTDDMLVPCPQLNKAVTAKGFLHRLYYCGAKAHRPLLYIQRIRNGWCEGAADPQKAMHSDTFHPTMKAWLFLEDVTPEKGPFTYVRGSQKLTLKRLGWEYRRSLVAARIHDGYSEKGSFRADDDDLKAMDLPAPEGLTAKAGTFVIANTNGFHGRGQAAEGASRLEIWAYSRHNPMNPLPGFASLALSRLEYALTQAFWRHKDREAAQKGYPATWHLIPAEKMLDGLED
ncbi:phytanoyl-CoA dioxygenase family protein [Kordiimonas marina]|uniref:phytanoyl-CoA dioxygenase family protein n=1 Tax=Kordiimonas marina TaxID=2872312 RepID=UPI001FF306BC|nr:phytanoyl-CoA dioxygenase family protein [Kordiimonas marina]MCJ9429741.1 phytanoyl-CoA dioxygenase family protein [Kordiimonas marina]